MKAIIVAMDKNRLIGAKGKLPWHLPNDLKNFRRLTIERTVIMGRKTFESIGKPLEKRTNIVLTTKPKKFRKKYPTAEVTLAESLEQALAMCKKNDLVYIIGGAQVYEKALSLVDKLYITEIDAEFKGDTWFPKLNMSHWRKTITWPQAVNEKNPYPHSVNMYVRRKK